MAKIIGQPYQGTHSRGNWQSDNAVDIALKIGTPIYAVADGVIGGNVGPQNSNDPRLAGLRFTLVSKGNQFFYGHLSKLVVKAGQRVRRGQIIGYSGEANGTAHLHFASKRLAPGVFVDRTLKGDGKAPAQPAQPAQPAPQADPAAVELPDLEAPPGPGIASPDTSLPGTAEMPYQPQEVLETWQMLANDPMASPETRRIAQRLNDAA